MRYKSCFLAQYFTRMALDKIPNTLVNLNIKYIINVRLVGKDAQDTSKWLVRYIDFQY